MAAPTITLLNHTVIDLAEAVTGWSDFDTLDTDIKKEGDNGITGTFRADNERGYFDAGSAPITAAGKTFRGWINTTNVPYMQPESSGGYEFYAYDGTTTEDKTAFGSDTYFGGWFYVVWDMDEFTTLTLANVQRWGIHTNQHTSGKNVDNMWADGFRYLDGYSMTGGTSGDEITLLTIEESDRGTTTLYGYGIVTFLEDAYFASGTIQFGTGATTTWVEIDGQVLIFIDKPVAAGLYALLAIGSGTHTDIKNSVLRAAGTTDATRYTIDFTETNLVAASNPFTDNLVVRASTVKFKLAQEATGNTFDDCGQITHNGADMSGGKVKNYEGAVDSSALIYDVNADPTGEMDDMVFTKGTAATHAIEFGLTSPLSMTLTGIDFSGYNAADEEDDSALHILRTTGDVEIALVGCSGTIKYKSEGANVTLTASKSATFTPIENGSAFTITKDSDNSILEDVASTTGGEVVYSYDGSLDDTAATVHIIIIGKEPMDFPWVVAEGTVPIGQNVDRNYSNP